MGRNFYANNTIQKHDLMPVFKSMKEFCVENALVSTEKQGKLKTHSQKKKKKKKK